MPTWPELHVLEVSEAYPDAIDALEQRLRDCPDEPEAVVRLGFNLWYAVAEAPRFHQPLPAERYASRFMELFSQYSEKLHDNADFCWVFGQGIQMFWMFIPGATERLGTSLIEQACTLDPFWAKLWTGRSDLERLRGRGIFQSYYNVK